MDYINIRVKYTAILSDSIIKHVSMPDVAVVHACRGATIDKLISGIQTDKFESDWSHFDLVIIHCGTNDIDKGDHRAIISKTQYFVHELKLRNNRLQVIISSILPRPCDEDNTNRIIVRVNQVMKVWADSKRSVHFAATFKTFIKNIKTKKGDDLYDDDGLHLSTLGTERTARVLRNLIHLFYQERLTIKPT